MGTAVKGKEEENAGQSGHFIYRKWIVMNRDNQRYLWGQVARIGKMLPIIWKVCFVPAIQTGYRHRLNRQMHILSLPGAGVSNNMKTRPLAGSRKEPPVQITIFATIHPAGAVSSRQTAVGFASSPLFFLVAQFITIGCGYYTVCLPIFRSHFG